MDCSTLLHLIAGIALLTPAVLRGRFCCLPVVFADEIPGNGRGRFCIMDYTGLRKVKSVFRATTRNGVL